MGNDSASETDSSDTNARIGTQLPAADRPNRTTGTVPADLADITNAGQSRFFAGASDGVNDDLGGFVADVTTVVQTHCEDYADIEALVCDLPIDYLTLAAHDSFAPYSGPYPMALLVRACLLKEINR